MTSKQVERYLNILEERNRIADRVEDKMLTRLDDFDLRNGQLKCLSDIARELGNLYDIAEAIKNNK